jgi:hypothetical protein
MGNEAKALLAVWMEPKPENEDDFNQWYWKEHFPERLAIPGFLNATRYQAVQGGPKYVAFYALESLDVLRSAAYQQARANATPWTRRVVDNLESQLRNEYELLSARGRSGAPEAPYLLMVRLETAPEHEEELNRWYEEEHIDRLFAVPGCLSARRYRATQGSPRYLALYELTAPDVPDSAAWHEAADTEWTLRMRPLFQNYGRSLGRRLQG